MLFQPTNITPSTRGGLGNGTVDATQALTVTWQVSGSSPLAAFSITLYRNNTASTQLYTTGRRTDGCPFYGTNYAGETQFFSYTIPASALSGAGVTNGNEYKLVITQWWSASESVTQNSAAVFLTRAAPTLTINSISSPVTTRSYTFQATYSQAQGDTLNWVRWMLAYAGDTENPFYDSQNIYGTAELAMTYDGLFRNTDYAVRCLIQTDNGVETDTGWVEFSVSYSGSQLEGVVTASRACDRSAVLVSWPAVQYIPADVTGDYSISADGDLVLPAGSSVSWDTVNSEAMSFTPPWTLFWSAKLNGVTGTLLTVGQSGGNITASYNSSTKILTISAGGTVLYQTAAGPTQIEEATMVLTEDTLYLRTVSPAGGLYPSTTLYPSDFLFPAPDDQENLFSQAIPVSYTQSAITSVTLGGGQSAVYVQIWEGSAPQSNIDAAYQTGEYTPEFESGVSFSTNFAESLNGGNLTIDEDNIVGVAVYRQEGTSATLRHLGDFSLAVSSMLDYGARNQQGPYLYYLFPIGETTYISDPIESNEVTICDWNWSLLECSRREGSGEFYAVDAEYRFGKNLVSGTVSNNNGANLMENFTAYPTVQLSPSNYKSGTLQSLIGTIDYACGNEYSDSLSLRDAIMALSVTRKTLFLKSRKGDLMKVRLAGAVTMETMDNTREQAQIASLPWAEIGDAGDAILTVTASDSFWEGSEAG